MKSVDSMRPSGTELVQKYIDALTNLITMERAKILADSSERAVLQNLDNLGARNGVYVTPDDIPNELGSQLIKDSLNSHLMKVQSEQIAETTLSEVVRSETETKKKYVGKKVIIDRLNAHTHTFESVMFDSQTGQYRMSPYTVKRVKGTIHDISFEHNVIVIQPSFWARKITPNRVLIDVHVLDLQNMAPNITVLL